MARAMTKNAADRAGKVEDLSRTARAAEEAATQGKQAELEAKKKWEDGVQPVLRSLPPSFRASGTSKSSFLTSIHGVNDKNPKAVRTGFVKTTLDDPVVRSGQHLDIENALKATTATIRSEVNQPQMLISYTSPAKTS